MLLACVGSYAYEVIQTLEFADSDDRQDVDKAIEAIEKHCVGEKILILFDLS